MAGFCVSLLVLHKQCFSRLNCEFCSHESGHTFGAVHDCESTQCASAQSQCCPLSSSTCDANGQYIMNPVSTASQTAFSPCTIRNICSQLSSGRVSTRCLVSNSNITTITDSQCGNGIVEVGEECDCGATCDQNSCCDGSTCRLRAGALCDDAASPCCTNCQFASADTVCRPAPAHAMLRRCVPAIRPYVPWIGFCRVDNAAGMVRGVPVTRHVPTENADEMRPPGWTVIDHSLLVSLLGLAVRWSLPFWVA